MCGNSQLRPSPVSYAKIKVQHIYRLLLPGIMMHVAYPGRRTLYTAGNVHKDRLLLCWLQFTFGVGKVYSEKDSNRNPAAQIEGD